MSKYFVHSEKNWEDIKISHVSNIYKMQARETYNKLFIFL